MAAPDKRDLVLATIQKYPRLSDRAIAKLLRANPETIAKYRNQPQSERLELSGRRARGRKPLPKTEERQIPGFVPEATVYLCYEKPVHGYAILLYVGCSMDVIKRIASHESSKPWWHEVHTIRLRHYPTVEAALSAERREILYKQPKYNIRHNTRAKPPKRI